MSDDPKAEQQEPSMEDILASIRRILSDDNESSEGEAEAAPPAETPAEIPEPAPDPPSLLSLDDDLDAGEEIPDSAEDLAAALFDTPDSPPPPASPPTPPPPPPVEPHREPEPQARAEDGVFLLTPDMRVDPSRVLSSRTSETGTDVLTHLAKAILDRRDIAIGTRDVTLEDMVRAMLKPLLREWLDRNLPYLIERLVKKEIDLMINRAERLEE